jgi:3-phosphoshikimate 1-carboxyvinyltransferase
VLEAAGAEMSISDKGVKIKKADLNAFNFDATDCPDLFPPLVALASFCNGKSTIRGVHRLQHKESDRGKTLQEEFGKLGVVITIHGDEMYIVGQEFINGGEVYSHKDHRIAMALAVAASRSIGDVIIDDADAINKSYPDFFTDLKAIGGKIIIKK